MWSAGVERYAVWLSGTVGSFADVKEVWADRDVTQQCLAVHTSGVEQFQQLAASEGVTANAVPGEGEWPVTKVESHPGLAQR